ncbi:hypothetical protein JN06_02716 [Bacteroides zoogleoformans]|nr:hypothetical protein JN06_02716 [Bacteroides zoogleoformans]
MIFPSDLSLNRVFKDKAVCVFCQCWYYYRVHLQFSKRECGIFSFFNITLCRYYTITNNIYQQVCNNLLELELSCTFYTNGFLGIWHSYFHKKRELNYICFYGIAKHLAAKRVKPTHKHGH